MLQSVLRCTILMLKRVFGAHFWFVDGYFWLGDGIVCLVGDVFGLVMGILGLKRVLKPFWCTFSRW